MKKKSKKCGRWTAQILPGHLIAVIFIWGTSHKFIFFVIALLTVEQQGSNETMFHQPKTKSLWGYLTFSLERSGGRIFHTRAVARIFTRGERNFTYIIFSCIFNIFSRFPTHDHTDFNGKVQQNYSHIFGNEIVFELKKICIWIYVYFVWKS